MPRLTDEQAAMADADAARYAGISADDARASYRDGDWARAMLRILDLLARAEKAEADCKAMAEAMTPVPPALIADGTALVWAIALDAPTDAVVRRWRP